MGIIESRAKNKLRILVTGGAGFIASYLVEKLIANDKYFVVVVDDLSTGSIDKLPKREQTNWKFIKCDVNNYRDISEIMLAYNFDYVFHYAAMVGVLRTQAHPVSVLQDLKGIENILNISKNSSVKRIFFSSSSEVYGEPVEFPQNEATTPLNSRVPYAVVKNACESFIKSYHQEFGLDYTIFRFFNTYGPKQTKDFVISKFIAQAINNKPITIYGDGTQTRTFCYIDDNIDACLNSAYNDIFLNDVVNIGGEIEIDMNTLANTIIRLTNSKSEMVNLPSLKDGDMKRRLPDISKMKNRLLKRDMITLEDGISRILADLSFII